MQCGLRGLAQHWPAAGLEVQAGGRPWPGSGSFNGRTKPHLPVKAEAHLGCLAGALCPAAPPLASRQMAKEMLISGAPRPPAFNCAFADGQEHGVCAPWPEHTAGRVHGPGQTRPGGSWGHRAPVRPLDSRAHSRSGLGLFSFHFPKMGS